MKEPFFLTLAEVIEIHQNQIDLYGGNPGVRDLGLLQSAVAQPQSSFGGAWLHEDVYAMAAAYAYHICQNHPFIDGNKRAALASALVFLELNGITAQDKGGCLYSSMMDIARGLLSKQKFAAVLKDLSGF